MASTLFSAIGRGYSARTILSSMARQSPKYGRFINEAYYYGYTANSILASIASRKDKKSYDPEMFLTDYEKTQNKDQERKKNQLLGTLAAAGTLGAIGVGLNALIQRNKPIYPEVLPALGKSKGAKGSKQPYTINRERPQIGNEQKQIANQQKQLGYIQPQQAPQQQSPQRPPPIYPPGQPSQAAQPPQQQSPQGPRPQQPQYNLKNVNLVNGFPQEMKSFRNIIEAGYDPEATELALRVSLPKDVLSIMDKTQGGLSQVIKDYSAFVKENPIKSAVEKNTQELQRQRAQKETFGQQEPQATQPKEASQQVAEVELPRSTPSAPQQAQQAQQLPQEQAVQPPQQRPQQIAPVEQPQVQKQTQPVKPLVSLKNGKVGTLEGIEKGVATINIDGNIIREKKNQLTVEGPEAEQASRQLINSIPEGMKSTALMSATYIPQFEMAMLKYWSGETAWFSGLPEEDYMQIAMGTYTPKGEAKTGIGEYNPSVADSHGAANHDLIVKNPRFSKENKGKTWGYAKNEFDFLHGIQKHLSKFSKERYDKEGKLITSKSKGEKQKKKENESDESGIKKAFEQMGGGIVEGLYNGIFKSLQEGKDTFSGIKDPLIQLAKPYYEKGLIKSPSDLKDFVNKKGKFKTK